MAVPGRAPRRAARLIALVGLALAVSIGPVAAQMRPPIPRPKPRPAAVPQQRPAQPPTTAQRPLPQAPVAQPPAQRPGLFQQPQRPAVATGPFSAEQMQVLTGINSYFNSIRTMEGDFIQFGPYGDQSEGVFFLERPGKIRFHYRPPARLDLIADGSSVMIRDLTAKTEDLYPLNRTPLKYLLAREVDFTSPRMVKRVSQEADLFSVIVDDNNSPADGKITLIFDRTTYELRQWVITDPQGLDTSVAIYNVETGKPVNPAYFRIQPQLQGNR